MAAPPDARFELELALRLRPYAQLAASKESSHRSAHTQDSLSNS